MPIKEAKKKVPKKKRGQKQKQKQIVKQNVKVTVQSSGGSGAGGTSVPASAPVYQMPQSFYPDQSLIRNLVQQAVKQQVKAPEYNPSNDETNFKAVFQGKSDLNKPLVAGVGVIEPEMQAKEKKKVVVLINLKSSHILLKVELKVIINKFISFKNL